ncbi:hypothetical protein D3H55_16670 [Bacillus salacetis]|uniref:Uncharacterized protein n=1 Tax=Bacillus salacetis TaxID=2315464 RepID=A0A3A1QY61_9BACI|nr:hypothetical protein [Bacillus salacetis]RIW30371.1 hypothetical protein D3H55_16670 [Bacillus salacetis]
MIEDILFTLLIPALIVSVILIIHKRRKANLTGFKTALTPICFFLVGVTNLSAYWFDFMGFLSWGLSVALFILGAYFTKYMPEHNEQS